MYSPKAFPVCVAAVLYTFFCTTLGKCVWNVTCPCGPSNLPFRFCLDKVPASGVSCATWSNCATCRSDLNQCLTCPEGLMGPLCNLSDSDSRSHREKRHHNTDTCMVEGSEDCGILPCPKSGSLKCLTRGNIKTCTAICLPGYTFEGRERESTEFETTCDGHTWSPRSSFPDCITSGQCDLVLNGGGTYNCTTVADGTYCDVTCYARSHSPKTYFCYPGKEWNPPLPPCVRKKEGPTNDFASFRPCNCQNGGTCYEDGSCYCRPGYTGKSCDKVISERVWTCPDPGYVRDGSRSTADSKLDRETGSFKEYSTLVYSCNRGYVINGDSTLTCLSSGRWSAPLPSCVPDPETTSVRYCNDPGTDPNADRMMDGSRIRSTSNFPQGARLDYNCKTGYTLQGQGSIFCLSTGGWSSAKPTCQINPRPPSDGQRIPENDNDDTGLVYCDSPGTINNGQFAVESSLYERFLPKDSDDEELYPETTRIVFSCDPGYSLVGEAILLCEISGFWDQNIPHCTRGTSNRRSFRQKRHHNTDTCMMEGRENCGTLRCPKSGSLKCTTRRNIKTCTATCLPGYAFQGRESESEIDATCDGHRWAPRSTFPDCVSKGECDLVLNGGGTYNCTTGVEGTFCDVTCYSRSPKRHYCYPGKEWSPPLPPCVREKEGPENDYVLFKPCNCQNGGSCNEDGSCACPPRYTGKSCDKAISERVSTATCSDPGLIRDGTRSTSDTTIDRRSGSFKEGSILIYVCNGGFVMNGDSSLTCLSSGRWSSWLPSCEPVPETSSSIVCIDPGQVANAKRLVFTGSEAESEGFQPGESVVFTCDSGYTRVGESHLTCLRTGRWSSSLPVCRRAREPTSTIASIKYCNDPGTDPNGERMMDGSRIRITGKFPQGSELDYTCKSGYNLQGEGSIFCLNTGRWSAARPSCQSNPRSPTVGGRDPDDDDDDEPLKYCDSPGPIDDGKWTVVSSIHERNLPKNPEGGERFPETTRIVFNCDDGYALVGHTILHCEQSGYWSQNIPYCTKDCGRSMLQTSKRISHGVSTSPGEWPWTVAIANTSSGMLSCGGSLIDSRTVLTAAHCLMSPRLERTSNFRLYFGKFYRDDGRDDNKVVKRTPSSFIVHPQYDTDTMDNDIALIKFQSPVKYSDRIKPVCMPTKETSSKNLLPPNKGYILGWGTTERNLPADELLMAYVPVLTSSQCLAAYESQNLQMPITDNMFCAGFPEGKASGCTGDSGGPIVFYDKVMDRHTVEGIVSFGARGQCGLAQRYTVFSQVSKYTDWIQRSTGS